MKKVAIYPGSFNPWHDGHNDVLDKALQVFDEVIIAQGINPEKNISERKYLPVSIKARRPEKNIRFAVYTTLLVDFIKSMPETTAIIRGLRDGKDLENERVQQYYNEDLAKVVGDLVLPPTVYFVTDRNLVHVSSSAIRAIEKFRRR